MMIDEDENEFEVPIEFTDNYAGEKPISFIDRDINGRNTFAITKFTNNGKYVRNNMIFYSLNGVEVYTDIKNMIFVNLNDKTMFIREYEDNKLTNIENSITQEEEKEYIILYSDIDDFGEDLPLKWESYIGRDNAYMGIVSNAAVIDIDKSIVLVDNVPLKDALSVREFVNYLKNANYVEEDNFDIDDYSGSGYI